MKFLPRPAQVGWLGFCLLLADCGAALCATENPTSSRFPKPNPARAYRELKILGPDGSPVRQPQEDWQGARDLVRTNAAWAEWLRERRRDVDDWMVHRQDRVEWTAGWWHDFVSPKDGSFLEWTPDEPGEETLRSRSDPKVKLTPKLHAAWVFGFRGRHADKIGEAAMLFRLTGERRYADWSAGQIDFYATNYARWPVPRSRKSSRLTFQSLDEAVNLTRYVNAVRILGDFAPPARKRQWFDLFFKPQADLLASGLQRIHNIACWHRAAEAQVAICFDDPQLWTRAVDSRYGLRRQVAEGVTSDYFWFEQSMGYNSYVVAALLPLFKFAALSGRAASFSHEMEVVQNLMLAPTAIRFPTGQLPNPADSTGGLPHAPNLGLWAAAYTIFPTPGGLATAARQKSWTTLLDPLQLVSDRQLPPVRSANLESSRMAVLKNAPWQVFFHYGQLDASHAQAEALNFELFYEDTDISHDPGTVGYGSPLHRNYYTTGLSHNVPLVDGLGQERWNPGQLISFDPQAGSVATLQTNYRAGVTATRELHIQDHRFEDVVRLHSPSNHQLCLVLHLQGEVESLPNSFTPDPEFAKNRPLAFGYWTNAHSAGFRDPMFVKVRFGSKLMRVTVSASSPYRLTHASAPDVPPRRREALYMETGGTNVLFRTVIEPWHKVQSPVIVK